MPISSPSFLKKFRMPRCNDRFRPLAALIPSLLTVIVGALSATVLLHSPVASAQTVAAAPRITSAVSDLHVTRLPGNVPLQARTRPDLGEASPSTQLTHIRLVLARSTEQEAALVQYLADLQNKSSENYHKWLIPEQFGKLYGPADSDVAAVVAWVESHGLKLEQVSTGRTDVAFSGTVSQVEEAFHIKIHSFQGKTQPFYSNVSDPAIPTALAPVVKGVAHLNTIRPTSHRAAATPGSFDPQSKRFARASGFHPDGIHPNLTLGSGTTNDPYFLYIVPGDAATIYNTPTTFNANFASSGTVYNGKGVTIGVGGDAVIKAATVADYRTIFLGDSTQPLITNVDGVTDTSDTDEAYIDTELSGGLAPGAAIHFYTSSDLTSGIAQALNDNTIDIFSLSFGECESDLGNSNNQLLNGYWQQAAGQGIAVTISTGDSGSAACDANADSNGNNIPTADLGLQVSGFASTIYNLAVGGTDLDGLNTNFTTYVTAPPSTSATFYRSVEKYIPESSWNDSSLLDTTISANVPQSGSSGNIVAAGGGKSSCAVLNSAETACVSGYPKPFWQRGTGVPADSVRDIPDVSLMSGNGFDPASWIVCSDDTGPNSSGVTITANCTTQSDGFFYFDSFGGTSTAAPAFAGILAIVQQKTGDRLGQAAKELYDLYNGSHASAIFHDTTVGNNSVPCDSGTPNCVKNSGGYFYESGYDTTAGYDLATGLGSVDVSQLVSYWGTGVGPEKATVTVKPSLTTVSTTQGLTVAVTVGGASGIGTPTGTVTLSGGGYSSPAATLSGAGGSTFTIAAGALAVGTDTLTVVYSGDVNYATASATTSVTVLPPFTLTAPPLTVTAGTAGTEAVTVTPSGGFTGTVTLTCSIAAISGGIDAPTCTGSTVTVIGAVPTTGNLTINTTAASSAAKHKKVAQADTSSRWAPYGAVAIAGLLLLSIPARRKSWKSLLNGISLLILFSASLGLLSSCGGSGGSKTPTASVSPTAVTFASTPVGTAATTQNVLLTNSGASTFTFSSAAISGTNASSFSETNNCPASIGNGSFCSITVGFTPAASGPLSATLSITDGATGSPQSVALTGTGTPTGTTAGSYTVTVTGTDSLSQTATTTFILTVN